jgi:hypothetical protein
VALKNGARVAPDADQIIPDECGKSRRELSNLKIVRNSGMKQIV